MSSLKALAIVSNNSTCGSTQPWISTLILCSGHQTKLCMYSNIHTISQTNININTCLLISQTNTCLLFRFSVDGTPVRVFKNREKELGGVDNNYHYPKSQAMRIYSSLWNAEDWATRGGLVKTDWTKAPFVASFSNFNAATSSNSATEEALDSSQEQRLQWVRKNYMIYDYCADTKRFPQGLPLECKWTLHSIPLIDWIHSLIEWTLDADAPRPPGGHSFIPITSILSFL